MHWNDSSLYTVEIYFKCIVEEGIMELSIFKPKSITLSDYFQIINPEYVYLQLIPNNSIRNYNSDRISKAISTLYFNIFKGIRMEDKKMFIYRPSKVSYYTYIEKNKVEFYFIIPVTRLNLIKDKIGDTWRGITIQEVKSIPTISKDTAKYHLSYTKEDALSLATDKRTNTLLSSTLNVINIMEEGDKVGIVFNFMPISQYSWRAEYESTLDKLKQNLPIDKEKYNYKYVLKMALVITLQTIDSIMNSIGEFLGEKPTKSPQNTLELPLFGLNDAKLSKSTKDKKESIVINTQIAIVSESTNKLRKENNAISVCQSFKSISEDNEFRYKRFKKDINFTDFNFKGVDSFKSSTLECQNFIALPGREILEEHKFIEKIDTFESEVPIELQSGVMCIGENTYKGKKTKAYLSNDKELRNLTLVPIAPTRSGKTTLLQNLTKNAIDNGECVIIPDFVSWCKMSHEIAQVIPKDNQLIIDCSDLENLEGLGFNETWGFAKTPLERYDLAKEQTIQLLNLIDCINESDKNLSAKMDRYLEASANIVFLNYGSVGDVYNVLRNHKTRQEFINRIPSELEVYFAEYIDTLNELNEYSKNKEDIIGTKLLPIAGILDRFNRLRKNTAMEIMLKKDCKNNINLLQEIQKPQVIFIKMPERRYKTSQEKDFLTTYWLSKLWQSLQIRDDLIKDRNKRVKVNLMIDEIYQVPQAQALLTEKLSQMAKFDCKAILSCHYLAQIPIIRSELTAANTSYMLIAGTDKKNYMELKEELKPYELEDLLNLKQYESLNLIKTRDGYAKFITKLPKPIV